MLFRNLLCDSRVKLLTKSATPLLLCKRITKRSICLQTSSLASRLPKTTLAAPLSYYNSRAFHKSSKRLNDSPDIKIDSLNERSIHTSKSVAWWLIGSSGLVFGIVVLGGLTRLTESGLSITEWRPVAGTLPPLNQKQWEEEFAKYRESPEFKQLNSHIDLDEFKFIFFMEWVHRLWGRAIGVVFILPAVYFAATKKTSRHVNKRMFGLTALLGLQGFVGWWMVYSGLDQKQLNDRKSKPTVSQYRLTTHLGAAFLLYMGMLWTGMEILRECKWVKDPAEASFEIV